MLQLNTIYGKIAITLFLAFSKAYLRFLCPINVLSEHCFPKIHITNLILGCVRVIAVVFVETTEEYNVGSQEWTV